jgi:hypothetical protein
MKFRKFFVAKYNTNEIILAHYCQSWQPMAPFIASGDRDTSYLILFAEISLPD